MTVIVGVDPGLTGAIAWLRSDGVLLGVEDLPVLDGEVSALLLNAMMREGPGWQPVDWEPGNPTKIGAVVLEWPGIMPKNGAKAAYSMGNSLGTINAVVQLYNAPSHRVAPGTWKKALGLTADKDRSRALATRTWPAWAASFARKKDDGRAEAALLAWWWLTVKMKLEVAV